MNPIKIEIILKDLEKINKEFDNYLNKLYLQSILMILFIGHLFWIVFKSLLLLELNILIMTSIIIYLIFGIKKVNHILIKNAWEKIKEKE